VEIRLSNGNIAIVDEVDADLKQLRWACHKQGYAQRAITVNGKATVIMMHRVILSRMLDRPLVKGEVVDHIDRCEWNNTRSNLRVATQSQNISNSKLKSGSKSGYRGVCSRQKRGWPAIITVKGKAKVLGHFDTPEQAARVYNIAAREYFGEFAFQNVIPEND
jgi:hypothetical protein